MVLFDNFVKDITSFFIFPLESGWLITDYKGKGGNITYDKHTQIIIYTIGDEHGEKEGRKCVKFFPSFFTSRTAPETINELKYHGFLNGDNIFVHDSKIIKLKGGSLPVVIAEVINCTPHPIVWMRPFESYWPSKKSEEITFPVSESVARVSQYEKYVQREDLPFPCVKASMGKVEGLPDPLPGIIYIVSRLVLDASDRTDLICPNTGASAIRDPDGHVRAVTSFIVK